MRPLKHLLLFLLLSMTLMPTHSYAYLGPGFGFGAIASLFALGSAFFITAFNFIWLPIKRFLGLSKNDNDAEENISDDDDSANQNITLPSKNKKE